MADPHFNHYNIIKYCNRPFDTVEQMNDTLLHNINRRVQRNDALFIVGDLGNGTVGQLGNVLDKIVCNTVHLITGNHDQRYINKERIRNRFTSISDLKLVSDHGKRIVLCHYAMRVWQFSGKGSLMFHGHSHGNLPHYPNSWDVGVDANDYMPVSYKEIVEKMDSHGLLTDRVEHHPGNEKDPGIDNAK